MIGWIVYGARWAWGWFAPFLGPVALAGSYLLPNVRVSGLLPTLALVGGVGVFAFVAYTWISRPLPPATVTVEAVEANRLRAELEAERRARIEAEHNARIFEEMARAQESQVAELEERNRRLRDASPNRSVAAIPADDPWLRGKREPRDAQ